MITNYKLFLERREEIENQKLNEGLFKNLFNFLGKIGKNIKGSKEVDKIFNNYRTKIDEIFNKWTEAAKNSKASDKNVKSNLEEGSDQVETPTVVKESIDQIAQKTQQSQTDLSQLDADALKKLDKLYTEQINKLQREAITQIEEIGKSLNAKNPSRKLSKYVTAKKYEFQEIVFKKKEEYYEKTGNKVTLVKVQKARLGIEKKYQESVNELKNLEKNKEESDVGNIKIKIKDKEYEIKIGDEIKYKTTDENPKDVKRTVKSFKEGGDIVVILGEDKNTHDIEVSRIEEVIKKEKDTSQGTQGNIATQ